MANNRNPGRYGFLVHHLLGRSVERHGERIAVTHGERCLRYHELAHRAQRLAAFLASQGLREGDRVALYLEKSIEAVIALFAILTTGCVYVPLDRHAPAKRLAVLLGDCGITAVIGCDQRLAQACALLPDDAPLRLMIPIDHTPAANQGGTQLQTIPWQTALATTEHPPRPAITEVDPAYILYTSGSSGTPKGVTISHRAALTFVDWSRHRFGLVDDDRVISLAPFHFDLSIFDLFTTVKAGATLVLPPAGLMVAPLSLARFIAGECISICYSTPAALTALVLQGDLPAQDFSALRLVLFAGDLFPPRYLRGLMVAVPAARYFNLYGPTETNVCTCYEVAEPPALDAPPIPIGEPCANTELLVLNPLGKPVAGNQPGELYVRTPALMSGYWEQPEQTAARLLVHPTRPWLVHSPFYRTGDRVKRLADGNLVFLGRCDNMIKSRGYRIEPEEIERVLVTDPLVDEAIIVPLADQRVGSRLAAMIATRAEPAPDIRALRRLCAEHLPNYMVPEQFTFTRALPKTSTGKLDRNLLRMRAAEAVAAPS